MTDLAKSFKYGKWSLIVLTLYSVASVYDFMSLHTFIVEKLKADPGFTFYAMSEVTVYSFLNFFVGAIFGALLGVHLYRRMLQEGD